jgi:hypothetical protein
VKFSEEEVREMQERVARNRKGGGSPAPPKPKKKHKYSAKAVTVDGIRFDSQKEAYYYGKLKLAQKAGELKYFLRQVPFYLPGGVRYVVDFVEFWNDGEVSFVDVKGYDTPQSKQKRKQVEALWPIKIKLA